MPTPLKPAGPRRVLMVIHRVGNSSAVRFAADQLATYLRRMTDAEVHVSVVRRPIHSLPGIRIGTFADLRIGDASPPDNPSDDHILVDVSKDRALIGGANPRSVLFAAYRWLESLGCRWLRPGAHGERIPKCRHPLSRPVRIDERPSYRHRCICIEGSVSREHLTSMIDYAAKRGFNAYFLQFRTSYTFFQRWYGEERPGGARSHKPFPVARAASMYRRAMNEVRRRGLMLHTVGHGWTCEPFGIPGLEWRASDCAVPPHARRHFARVNGKRDLSGGIPLNTQLCYSQPAVRNLMATAVADYAGQNPGVDIVHVWLADGANNFCECRDCRKHRPSDLYVKLLNEIDRLLTARGMTTRIVFLAYVDLLWAPIRERIENPSRFILMFAPITRSYSRPFLSKRHGKRHPGRAESPTPYRLNRLKFPSSPEANLALFAGWERAFPLEHDRVDFDYPLWRDWCHDPGQMQAAPVIHADACALAPLGMQGYISCQAQRVAYPTGLPLHLLGAALWNRHRRCRPLIDGYLQDCFGDAGPEVRRYLENVSRRFDPPSLRGEKTSPAARAAQAHRLSRVRPLVNSFAHRIDALCRSRDAVTAAGGRILRHHARYLSALANLHALILKRDPSAAAAYSELAAWLDDTLPDVADVFDTWMAREVIRNALRLADIPFAEPPA